MEPLGELDNIVRHCGFCGNQSDPLKLCGSCKSIRYCSVDHQKRHWRIHRTKCKKNFQPGLKVESVNSNDCYSSKKLLFSNGEETLSLSRGFLDTLTYNQVCNVLLYFKNMFTPS